MTEPTEGLDEGPQEPDWDLDRKRRMEDRLDANRTSSVETPPPRFCGFCDGDHDHRLCPHAQNYIRHEQGS